jgi:hypothetical protein
MFFAFVQHIVLTIVGRPKIKGTAAVMSKQRATVETLYWALSLEKGGATSPLLVLEKQIL